MNETATRGLFQRELPYPDSSLSLFRRLRHLPLPVLLASGDNVAAGARYDIISAAPQRSFRTRGLHTVIREADGTEEAAVGNPLDILQGHFGPMAAGAGEAAGGLPFCGGALGYFSYELLHPIHGLPSPPPADIPLPQMLVGLYHWTVVVDHLERRCHFTALPTCPAALREAVLDALGREAAPQGGPCRLMQDFASNFTREEYLSAFGRIIDYIHAGDCYQVNLAQRFSASCGGDPLAAFEHLQGLANAPFAAYMESGEGSVLSFSPERFIQVNGGRVITQPIKGTRPRDPDPARDRALREELAASQKDRAENLMIVDLLRNDLGRVCRTGSVSVPSLFEIQSFRNVHHMVSTVEGRLDHPEDVFALFKSCFPGGSITGAPKRRAMEIIDEVETRARSVYCGAIGYIGFDGGMDSNIGIRTLVHAGDRIHCWGGGGIVADSRGDLEYQETLDKISLFLGNLEVAGQ